MKPRTYYSSHALKRVMPNVNIASKREALTNHSQTLRQDLPRHRSKLFQTNENGQAKRVRTISFIPKQLSIRSVDGLAISKGIQDQQLPISKQEVMEESENSSNTEKSDSSSNEEDDSSVDYDMEDEDEEALY